MVYYDRIDISEDIDVIKTVASKECNINCYWYFLDKGLSFNCMSAMGGTMYQ